MITIYGCRTSSAPGRASRRSAAVCSLLLVIVGSGCGGASGSPATPPSAALPSGYGPEAFLRCLDDRGVLYRESDAGDGGIEIVDAENLAVIDSTTYCREITTPSSDPDKYRYANEVTTLIAKCLLDRGYHVTISSDDELVGSGGQGTVVWNVPAAEQESEQYSADESGCEDDAIAHARQPGG